MTVHVLDTATAMRRILDAPPHQHDVLVRAMWEPLAGMYAFLPTPPDLALVHRQNFGFGPDADPDELRRALDRLEQVDAWSRIERAAVEGLEVLRAAAPHIDVPSPTVLFVLGDPTSAHFLDEVQGLSAFGGISGYISITVWPNDQVVDRLEAITLHELHHNVRYVPGGVVWDPRTVTVGEQVVAEGLADLFATELCGSRGPTHFVADETRHDDAVLHRVIEGLDVTDMTRFAAWVLGDASARLLGTAPVGLPTGAGYAAGTRIVREYLGATGRTAAQCVGTPSQEILDLALSRLGESKII